MPTEETPRLVEDPPPPPPQAIAGPPEGSEEARDGAATRPPRIDWRRSARRLGFLTLAATAAGIAAILLLRFLPPPTSAMVLRQRWTAGAKSGPIERAWVPWEQISPHVALAVVAAEDQRFPDHWGLDPDAIADAWEGGRRGRRRRGASTITQQVAKNLFLWPGRSYLRKGLEAGLAVTLETLWSKRRILEVYLNFAQLGERTFGVEAASRRYFRKPAAKLTASEAALLAAVLPNPVRFRVDRPSAYVLERQQWILLQMQQLGGTSYLGFDAPPRRRDAPS